MEEYTARHKLCDLAVYFARPATAELSPMTFKDFFCNYTVMRTEPKTGTRFQLHELNAPMFGTKNVYIRKREKPVLCRLQSVSHASGDLWYQRILLRLFAFPSLKSMYEFADDDGTMVTYSSFQKVCVVREIATEKDECIECFKDAVTGQGKSPRDLRGLFVSLAINAYPVIAIYDILELRNEMFEGSWINRQDLTDTVTAIQELLKDLSKRFADHGKTLTDFGLPEPADYSTELARFQLRFDMAQQATLFQQLSTAKELTVAQKAIFDKFVDAVRGQTRESPGIFLTLEGAGGSGKTETAKHIMAYLRSLAKADGSPYLIHTVCSTALGSQNFPAGECTTAHSFFVLPVEQEYDKELEDDEMESLVDTKPERRELIEALDVVFWDEAMSNHRECLEAVMLKFDNFKGN
jgi:hypothetical protein